MAQEQGHAPSLESDPWDLYENAPCGYLSTALNGTILRANRTFLEWTGHSEDLVGSKKFSDLLTAGGRIYHETHYAPLLRMQGFAREIAVDIVAADGKRLPALVNAVVKDPSGGSGQVVRVAIFDASDRREYERELLRARKAAEAAEVRARDLAETLQQSLIPPTAPQIPTLDVGAAFRPSGSGAEVGGDFYDVFEVTDGDWAVIMGDVRGKGAQAATVTALARYTLRAAAMQTRQPCEVLSMLNEAMLHQKAERFCTVSVARVTISADAFPHLALCSGGHPLPILVGAEGAPRQVGEFGTLIGLLPDPELSDRSLTLAPGDSLTFYTDGVTEGRAGDEFFGEERLLSLLDELRSRSAADIADAVVETVVGFQGGSPKDDVAVLVLRVP